MVAAGIPAALDELELEPPEEADDAALPADDVRLDATEDALLSTDLAEDEAPASAPDVELPEEPPAPPVEPAEPAVELPAPPLKIVVEPTVVVRVEPPLVMVERISEVVTGVP